MEYGTLNFSCNKRLSFLWLKRKKKRKKRRRDFLFVKGAS